MPLTPPLPDLDELLTSMGEGGRRIALIDAGEGAAGNISTCIGWPIEVRRRFPVGEPIELPVPRRISPATRSWSRDPAGACGTSRRTPPRTLAQW